MTEATNVKPKRTMPQTGADITRLAEGLMISRARLAEVIGVTTAALNQKRLSGSTQDRLQPLLDIYNRALDRRGRSQDSVLDEPWVPARFGQRLAARLD